MKLLYLMIKDTVIQTLRANLDHRLNSRGLAYHSDWGREIFSVVLKLRLTAVAIELTLGRRTKAKPTKGVFPLRL